MLQNEIKGVDITTAVPIETLKQNILDARKHLIAPISSCLDWREDRPIALVGGGPSLSTQLDKLREYDCVMVCGSAHDYLVDSGIRPNYCIICDPDPIMCKYLILNRPGTTYLIASQCHESVFELLIDQICYTWHAASGQDFDKEVFPENEPKIVGGCTIGTRAIGMAMAFGFKKIHLFGYDTCLTDDYKHHAYDFVNSKYETLGDITEITLDGPEGKKFKVAGYMLAQLFDFKNLLSAYSDKLDITVFGDGLLAHLMEIAKSKALKEKGT